MRRGMIGKDQDIEIAALDLGKGLAHSALILVSATHHPFRAARKAAAASAICRSVSNRAKQVAPDPDMRARRNPPQVFNAASTSAITGAAAMAGGSRSLRPSLISCSSPSAARSAEHTSELQSLKPIPY